MRIDFARIDATIQMRDAVANWLPNGRLQGHEWVALNPTRDDRRLGSFKINLNSGYWADFATGDKGKGPLSLYAYLNGLSLYEAALKLIQITGDRL